MQFFSAEKIIADNSTVQDFRGRGTVAWRVDGLWSDVRSERRNLYTCFVRQSSAQLKQTGISFAERMPRHRVCPFCQNEFEPSQYHPDQRICSAKECQKKRRLAYHRKKLLEDPEYAEQCRESRKKWRENNRPYLAQYRKLRKLNAANIAAQQININRNRLLRLIQQSSVFDLREFAAEIWLLCAGDRDATEKVLANAKAIILHAELSSSLSGS